MPYLQHSDEDEYTRKWMFVLSANMCKIANIESYAQGVLRQSGVDASILCDKILKVFQALILSNGMKTILICSRRPQAFEIMLFVSFH